MINEDDKIGRKHEQIFWLYVSLGASNYIEGGIESRWETIGFWLRFSWSYWSYASFFTK